MPIVAIPNAVGLEFHYYNITDDDDNNYDGASIKNSILSFFASIFLLFLFIQFVRCCVFLSDSYSKKQKFRRLNNLNIRREGVNNECPICLDTVNDKFVLECNHAFNKKCFYQWVETSIENNCFKCPLCNVVYTIN